MWRAGFFDHTESGYTITATANASGIAQGFLGPVPQGYCWYVERMTTFAPHQGVLEVFVQTTQSMATGFSATVGDRAGRQDLSLVSNNDVSDERSPIYVGEGYYLVAFWTGLTSADVAQLSTQIAVHLLSLNIEPRQMVQQQTEPTPDIDAAEVHRHESVMEQAMHATADLMRGGGKDSP